MNITEKQIKVNADVIRLIAEEIDNYGEEKAQWTMAILMDVIERLQKGE